MDFQWIFQLIQWFVHRIHGISNHPKQMISSGFSPTFCGRPRSSASCLRSMRASLRPIWWRVASSEGNKPFTASVGAAGEAPSHGSTQATMVIVSSITGPVPHLACCSPTQQSMASMAGLTCHPDMVIAPMPTRIDANLRIHADPVHSRKS